MKRLVLIGVAAAALAAPGVASAHSRGVVVKVERAKDAFAVARAGHVAKFHNLRADRLHVGQVIRFDAHRREARDIHVVGRAQRTEVLGTVTAVTANSFTVSSGGVQFMFTLVGAAARVGSTVRVEVSLKVEDDRDEVEVQNVGPAIGEVEGRLTIGTGTITVGKVVIAVPVGVDLSGFRTGDFVEATLAQDASGRLVLAKLEREDEHEDDDEDHGGRGHGGHGPG
jgi:hypothetical protein